jgi:hypothetical protein
MTFQIEQERGALKTQRKRRKIRKDALGFYQFCFVGWSSEFKAKLCSVTQSFALDSNEPVKIGLILSILFCRLEFGVQSKALFGHAKLRFGLQPTRQNRLDSVNSILSVGVRSSKRSFVRSRKASLWTPTNPSKSA